MPNDIPNPTWNESDASNTSPVPNGAPEGWFPADVNAVYRMGMGATKRFWDHINPTETTGGTSTAYTLTYDVAPQQLWAGEIFSFTVDQLCGAAPTLNVNALGARNLRKFTAGAWANMEAGDLAANQVVAVFYNSVALTFDIVAGYREDPFSGGTLTSTTNMSGAAFNEAKATNLASASTVNIGAANGNYIHITGVTAITAFDTVQAGTERVLVFDDALILTHNATSLILPTGANITTAAGDTAIFRSEGSGNWKCVDYLRASGLALAQPAAVGSIRAWANWSAAGPTLNASGNVSGVAKNGTGDYTITFSAAIPANASCAPAYLDASNSGGIKMIALSTGSVRIQSFNAVGTPFDFTSYSIALVA